MRIDFIDERDELNEGGEVLALAQEVAREVLKADGITREINVGLTLVTPERIQEINNAYRKVDTVTDVLSFPLVAGRLREKQTAELVGGFDPEDGTLSLGDILINPVRVREQAAEYGHSEKREMGYLIAHGMLHLLGYDHETDEERAVMRELEEQALAKIGLTR